MEVHRHDVLIVGGGAAGLRAAIAAVEADPRLSVALVSKVYPMRSHTVSAEGGAAAVMREDDSHDLHCYDTIKGSDFLADQDAVEAFVAEAPREIVQLERWGCPWSREADGRIAVRAFGGMSVKRTVYAADKVGFHMLHTLFQTSMKYDRIVRYDEWFVTSLAVEDGRIAGLSALEIRTGKMHAVAAKAVVMATGGAGRLFAFTTNGFIKTGDGMALAYRAGVPLKDMEFVQYHPTGLPGTGILITEAARGEGGYLVNAKGERFLARYVPGKMELGPRDMLSRAIMKEIEAGNAFEGPYGHYVHLDLRHLGEAKIDSRLPFVRELSRKYVGIDPVHEPIPVRPVVHYMMGGISTDAHGRTVVPGLFAAGECACVSMNGANRLGSNSLSECLVFGARAGRAAAAHAADAPEPNASRVEALAADEERRIRERYLARRGGGERVAAVRADLQAAMERGCGVYREESRMKRCTEEIAALRERFARVSLDDTHATFNTDLVGALELDAMLDVAAAMAHGALLRQESRGSHTRTDFPARDDVKFLSHTLAHRGPTGPRIEYVPVTITRWPPEERKY
jgi:fumarate reductase flavoprotein subunit